MPVPIFPELENSKIDTIKFLLATEDLISVVEKFGRLFSQITGDMSNNVKKIQSVYDKDTDSNKFIHDLILIEKRNQEGYATDALLWLKRALHFTLRIFEQVEMDIMNGVKDESIEEHVKLAYKENLEPYHNWAAKKLFQLFCKLTPSKSKIIQCFGIKNEEEIVKEALSRFNSSLRICVLNLNEFYETNGLENNNVVDLVE